ncbi:uncharacterized protein LOC117327840 [Pecten maximus]|uniref:uncharacterized protein LOC117327840 n=1 Tax=Pecten maximus TaxID=6579 RepID=UPI001458921D|nr:uncharacterized protein LOC117327840 [Pecten maximus]
MHVLIEFTDEQCLAIIPDTWKLGKTRALWPNTQNATKLQKMVKSKQDPDDEEWESFPIRVLYENESYDKVRSKLKRAEEESDLATAVSEDSGDDDASRRSKRKRRAPQQLSSDDDQPEMGYMSSLPKPPAQRSTLPKKQPQQHNKTQPLVSKSSIPKTPQHQRIQSPQSETPTLTRPRDISNARDVRLFTLLEQIKSTQVKQQTIMETILKKS